MLYVYVGCFAFGVLYSIISAFLGSHGFDHGGVDHGGFDHSGAVDHSTADTASSPSPFNPLVIASAIATFGAAGLIGEVGLKMGQLLSLLMAILLSSLVGTAIFFFVVKLMYSSQSDSTFSIEDLEGTEAEVITPVPANGMGEVAYLVKGIRYNISARSAHGEEIARGEIVRIKEVKGNCALVVRKLGIDDLELRDYDTGHEKEKETNLD